MMTPHEFKAWFDGFTEAMDEKPTAKQWQRIKDRVAEIDGKAVTEKIYVDRYLPAYPPSYPYWRNYGPIWATCNATDASNKTTMAYAANNLSVTAGNTSQPQFQPLLAMADLGRADAAALNA